MASLIIGIVVLLSLARSGLSFHSLQHQPQQHKSTFCNTPACARRRASRKNTLFLPSASSSSLPSVSSSWQSHVSTHPNAESALQKLLNDLDLSVTPDLAFLFVAQFHAAHFESLVRLASSALPTTRLVSLVGGGVIGDDIEIDEPSKPGLSLLAGCLPNGLDGVQVFSFNELTKPPPPIDSTDWMTLLAGDEPSSESPITSAATTAANASVLLFADPWSPVEHVIKALESHGSAAVAGGITVPTGTGSTLAIDGMMQPQGSLIGVCFQPQSLTKIEVVVAQGCRPVGPAYTITAADRNVILQLDAQPALRVLEDFLRSIDSQAEKNAISSGLICGIRSNKPPSTTGAENTGDNSADNNDDYLIRQMLGFVPSKGGIAVAGLVETSDQLRFHVRDQSAATLDLALMVQRAQAERLFGEGKRRSLCALQVSCVARGRAFFGTPNVDLSQTKALLSSGKEGDGAVAVAGFYANGEIGPVGIAGILPTTATSNKGTFLHGFTTVIATLVDVGATATASTSPGMGEGSNGTINEPSDAWG